MRSKYCFRPEDLSSAVFCFESAYLRTTTEHPEDLFTLYVVRVQKRSGRTFGVFSGGKVAEVGNSESSVCSDLRKVHHLLFGF